MDRRFTMREPDYGRVPDHDTEDAKGHHAQPAAYYIKGKWTDDLFTKFLLTLGVMLLFLIACELAVLVNLAWRIGAKVETLVDNSNDAVIDLMPVARFAGSAVSGVTYNMTKVVSDSLPETHDGMVSLLRGVWTGSSAISNIIDVADRIGLVEGVYPLLIGLGWMIADNRTGEALASTGDVIGWVADKATAGEIDAAAGFTANTTMILLDYTMTAEAHESLRFGLELANQSIPILEALHPLVSALGRASAHESLPLVADRIARGVEFTTEGAGMYRWVRYAEAIRDDSQTLVKQAVDNNVLASLSDLPSVVENITDVVRSVTRSEIRLSVGSALGADHAVPSETARSSPGPARIALAG